MDILREVDYQLKFLLLFALRGRRSIDFNLATEMKKAEGFHDVVFEFQQSETESAWHFLQVKHSSTKNKLQIKDLESKKKTSPFSISKYFDAYCEIKKEELFKNRPESHKFAVVTNRQSALENEREKVRVRDMICSIAIDPFHEDDILYFENGQNRSFAAKKYKLKCDMPGRDKLLDSFLNEFFIVTDYPNDVELEKLIENELSKCIRNEQMIHFVYLEFEYNLKKFFSKRAGSYYVKADVELFIKETRSAVEKSHSDSNED